MWQSVDITRGFHGISIAIIDVPLMGWMSHSIPRLLSKTMEELAIEAIDRLLQAVGWR
jgi:hypothetical protein